jgi:hypothetical protein
MPHTSHHWQYHSVALATVDRLPFRTNLVADLAVAVAIEKLEGAALLARATLDLRVDLVLCSGRKPPFLGGYADCTPMQTRHAKSIHYEKRYGRAGPDRSSASLSSAARSRAWR